MPISKDKIFDSETSLLKYIENIKLRLNNLRTLQFSEIQYTYGELEEDIIPVTLNLSVKDTWNIIAVPYPRFDSNSGFMAKIKLKDFNFLGLLQTLSIDLSYLLDEQNKSAGEVAIDFGIPFKAGVLDAIYKLDTSLSVMRQGIGFNLGNDIEFKYPLKYLDLHFGFYQGFHLNKVNSKFKDEKAVNASPTPGGENKDKDGNDFFSDKYYFSSKLYFYTPIKIYRSDYWGNLVWTPYISVSGNWAFKKLIDKRETAITFSHSLSLSQVNWLNNFRQGFSVSFSNSYFYNFIVKTKTDINFGFKVQGYYSFFGRVGIYTQLEGFYFLFGKKTEQAGYNLRGILNKRIKTDSAITLNIDIPIRITSFDFEEITGVSWTRYFGFDWHISPFIDMAWTHDPETGRTFHPADGWYSGGFELIIYPIKMRSIYARVSLGYDLSELKNVKGFFKGKGTALRDGQPISEIFIGIGLHY